MTAKPPTDAVLRAALVADCNRVVGERFGRTKGWAERNRLRLGVAPPIPRHLANLQDLKGRVVGVLTVISYVGPRKQGSTSKALWRCRCSECQGWHEVTADGIRNEKYLRCPGRKRPTADMVGQTFGKLLVLDVMQSKDGARCRCRCLVCRGIYVCFANHLRRAKTSQGCKVCRSQVLQRARAGALGG